MADPTLSALRQQLIDAFNRADADTLAGQFAEDGELAVARQAPSTGRAAIEAFFQIAFAGGLTRVALDPLESHVADGFAVDLGRFELFAANDLRVDFGSYMLFWIKDGDTWRLKRETLTSHQTL